MKYMCMFGVYNNIVVYGVYGMEYIIWSIVIGRSEVPRSHIRDSQVTTTRIVDKDSRQASRWRP